MFLQLFIFGSFNPIQSLYLQRQLGMDGTASGLVIGFGLVFGLVSPFLGSLVADRFISSRKLLQVCHGVASVLIVVFSFRLPVALTVITYFLFSFMQGPTYSLVNSLTFANLKDSSREYGTVRSWGTLGWIVAGYTLSALVLVSTKLLGIELAEDEILPWAYRFAGIAGIVLVALLFRLPADGVAPRAEKRSLFPSAAIRALKQPAMLLLVVYYFLSGMMDRFYVFGAGPYLAFLEVPDALIMPALTLGQVLEVPALLLLGKILAKRNPSRVLLFGMAMQVCRFALFSLTSEIWPLLIALSLNGLIFAFFYTPATILIDSLSCAEGRSGVHQITGIFFVGIGGLLGNGVAGVVLDALGPSPQFWYVPLVASGLLALSFFLFPGRSKILGKRSPALLE